VKQTKKPGRNPAETKSDERAVEDFLQAFQRIQDRQVKASVARLLILLAGRQSWVQ